MADHTAPEVLARLATLEQRLGAQEATIQRQGRELAWHGRRRRYGRSARRALPLVLAALLVALVPLATLAANPFTDLTGGPHDANIDAIYNAGITTGCGPTEYCPTENVTRQEMASFLARAAGLGTNPPIANARTALTATTATDATNAQNAVNATNAGNAATVGGLAPSGLVRVARTRLATGNLGVTTTSFGPALTIQAPAPGFVLVTGVVTFDAGSAGPSVIFARVRHIQSESQSADTGPTVPANGLANAAYGWVFPVGAGPNTFDLRVSAQGSGARIYTGELAALYVPFGSTGAGTLGADQPQPADGGDKPKP